MEQCKKITYLALVVIALVGIAGCNTIEGMGKDIEKGGKAIQETVN